MQLSANSLCDQISVLRALEVFSASLQRMGRGKPAVSSMWCIFIDTYIHQESNEPRGLDLCLWLLSLRKHAITTASSVESAIIACTSILLLWSVSLCSFSLLSSWFLCGFSSCVIVDVPQARRSVSARHTTSRTQPCSRCTTPPNNSTAAWRTAHSTHNSIPRTTGSLFNADEIYRPSFYIGAADLENLKHLC